MYNIPKFNNPDISKKSLYEPKNKYPAKKKKEIEMHLQINFEKIVQYILSNPTQKAVFTFPILFNITIFKLTFPSIRPSLKHKNVIPKIPKPTISIYIS